MLFVLFFFFQAEDGIRDLTVTGVQTCALPISALMLPLALALLSAAFPPQRRAWALGIFSSVTGIAVLAGPVVGGAVAQGLDWPWIFWLNVPIGLVMIPLILARIPVAERARASLDPIGLL